MLSAFTNTSNLYIVLPSCDDSPQQLHEVCPMVTPMFQIMTPFREAKKKCHYLNLCSHISCQYLPSQTQSNIDPRALVFQYQNFHLRNLGFTQQFFRLGDSSLVTELSQLPACFSWMSGFCDWRSDSLVWVVSESGQSGHLVCLIERHWIFIFI